MTYRFWLLLLFLIPGKLPAQPAISGLGPYALGSTTPDSLTNTAFREEGQSLVKGTIALPCAHIRTFRASSVTILGLVLADVYLFFYDNTLFKISCPYPEALEKAFVARHGKGSPTPPISRSLCPNSPDKPMTIRREVWPNGDIMAVAVQASGYTAGCQPATEARLTVVSQRFSALSSDCDLTNPYRFIGDMVPPER
ncbi:hypothetical protein [Spirosoma aerophilum]